MAGSFFLAILGYNFNFLGAAFFTVCEKDVLFFVINTLQEHSPSLLVLLCQWSHTYNGISTLEDYGDTAGMKEKVWLWYAETSSCDLHPFSHSLLLTDREKKKEENPNPP